MEVISLIDNQVHKDHKDLHNEHGLSLFISSNELSILFDTGRSGHFLLNAQSLDLKIRDVNLAVVSHHHIDHGGGLPAFLEVNHQAAVYLRSSTNEQFFLNILGLYERRVGLDESLYQRYPQRFLYIDRFSEIAAGVFILTRISKRHAMPKGNRHLFVGAGSRKVPDDFDHELILVIQQSAGLVVFTGCSHHGILNMLDTVLEYFPGQGLQAIFGGFHLVDLPLINNLAGRKVDIEDLGKAILEYPIEKIYTGHCTGKQAFRILKNVLGTKLQYFATGDKIIL